MDIAEFEALGVSVDVESDEESDVQGFPVWKENWRITEAFLAAATQWRVVATLDGLVWIGIDYAAVLPIVGSRNRRHTRELFAGLRIMELAALPNMNARRPQDEERDDA